MDLKMEVYSPSLELLGLLEIQQSVIWETKAFSAGSFSLNSLITEESRTLLTPENIIWIAGEDAGIIEYVQQQAGESGPYITVKGCGLTGILARRILWGRYDLSGPVPALMYQLVDDCCIHPTRGDTEARVIPGLRLSDVPAGGTSIQTQKTGGTLLEALELLGGAYQVPFGVRFVPEVPCMEFWARPGVNRSVHQTVNEPVFYSTELDDVLSSEYSYNAQDYKNVALVAGEGEGDARTLVTVYGKVEAEPEPPTPPEPAKYTISLSVDPEGGGLASGGGEVEEGKRVTVTATPAAGYSFAGWSEGGAIVSTSPSYTFTVTGDRTLTAVFAAIVPTYTISATIDPAGSGAVTGAGRYQEGASVTLTAAPGEDYKFVAWTENGETVSKDAEYTFTASADRTLVAVFAVVPASRLPEGYTEVEYIESATPAYINTGVKPDATIKFVIDVEPTSDGSTLKYMFYSYYAYSSTAGTTKHYFYVAWNSSGARAVTGALTSISYKTLDSNKTAHRMVITIDYPNKVAFVDGGTEVALTNIGVSSLMNAIYLLRGSGNANALDAKIYSCQIETGGEMVRNFVPCVNPDGECGLYDLIDGLFYGNANTTGSFAAGPAV